MWALHPFHPEPSPGRMGGNVGRGPRRPGDSSRSSCPRITVQLGMAIPAGSPSEECACVFGGTTISPAPSFKPAHSRMNEHKPERPTPILPNPMATALVWATIASLWTMVITPVVQRLPASPRHPPSPWPSETVPQTKSGRDCPLLKKRRQSFHLWNFPVWLQI